MDDAEDDAPQLEGDRKTVEALRAHGDPLTKARQVDHWILIRRSSSDPALWRSRL
jgi:hypothetical protein